LRGNDFRFWKKQIGNLFVKCLLKYRSKTLEIIYLQEYENQTSLESKFIKDLDRFDMILQAFEYETTENRPKALQEFFNSCEG
jgi:5'-deoxynucleotidase YfbR-like HD superfamily hydrolase